MFYSKPSLSVIGAIHAEFTRMEISGNTSFESNTAQVDAGETARATNAGKTMVVTEYQSRLTHSSTQEMSNYCIAERPVCW